jgi:hypothetical protein
MPELCATFDEPLTDVTELYCAVRLQHVVRKLGVDAVFDAREHEARKERMGQHFTIIERLFPESWEPLCTDPFQLPPYHEEMARFDHAAIMRYDHIDDYLLVSVRKDRIALDKMILQPSPYSLALRLERQPATSNRGLPVLTKTRFVDGRRFDEAVTLTDYITMDETLDIIHDIAHDFRVNGIPEEANE